MTFTNTRAGLLIYTINALAELDRSFTTLDAVRAGESGFVSVFLTKINEYSLDLSLFESWLAEGTESRSAIDDLFARWTNATEAGQYWLPEAANGWLWLSSIAVNVFLVSPYGDLDASTN